MVETKTHDISTMPLCKGHYRVLFTSSLGQITGTALATTVGIVIPLMQIVGHPELSATMQGLIGAADLIGIAVGSALVGRIADRYGYLTLFRLCPALTAAAAIVAALIPSLPVLLACLFIMGLGIGGEYSLDSGYVSEIMPVRWRSTMVGIAKAACAIGNILAAGLCWLVISGRFSASQWPLLMWIIAGCAMLMVLTRINFAQSPLWLLERGRTSQAEEAARKLLGPGVTVSAADVPTETGSSKSVDTLKFLKENPARVILSGIPWACEGLGVYGIGVFLPILVASLGLEHFSPGMTPVEHVAKSTEITLWISCIILPGFILGLLLLHRVGNGKLQSCGFYLSAAALVLLLISYELKLDSFIIIGSFMAFELFLNMGPHLVTYVLPSSIYPVESRAQGSGIAACIGKIGAVLGVFFMPVLLHAGGMRLVLIISAGVMLAGAVITNVFGKIVRSKQ